MGNNREVLKLIGPVNVHWYHTDLQGVRWHSYAEPPEADIYGAQTVDVSASYQAFRRLHNAAGEFLDDNARAYGIDPFLALTTAETADLARQL